MNISLNELIPDMYYCCIHENYHNQKNYYKFKLYNNEKLEFHYKIVEENGIFKYKEYRKLTGTLEWFNGCSLIEEVNILFIGKYLPKKHPDLFIYRQKKIESLLCV